jgi:predicted  nucleic acid-binding Zn-ribbon protein
MGRFEDKSQLIDASSTQRDASQDRDRRLAARLDRLNQASIVDARRRVAQMEATIANFGKTIRELEGWIETERSRPGTHYDSTLANSLTQRRDTLKRSIEELERKLAETRSYA